MTAHLAHPDNAADFDATQPSGSHIFPDSTEADIDLGDELIFDASGVDLLNPDKDSGRLTGPKSSIFGAASRQETARLDPDEIVTAEDATEHVMSRADEGGSSIFNKTSPQSSFEGNAERAESALSAPSDDQPSGRIDWAARPLSGEMQPTMDTAYDEIEDDAEVHPFSAETLPPAPKRGMVGTSGAGAVVAPAKPGRYDDDDDLLEAPKPKREPPRPQRQKEPKRSGGGLLGWVAGGLLGLLFGAGAVAALHFGNVLPGQETAKSSGGPTVQPQPPTGGPSPELAELEAKQEKLRQELMAATKAEAEAAAKLAKQEEDFNGAKAIYAKELVDAAKAKADVDIKAALKKKDAAEAELKTAQAEAAQAEEDAKQAKLTAAKAAAALKDAAASTEAAKAETKIYRALADKTIGELETVQKDLEAKGKLARDAQGKVTEALKNQIAAEAALGSVVKELKANKLLDEKFGNAEALELLPDILKKLNAQATSADAKKAAEALTAARKELDGTREALKSAEAAKAKADAAAKLAKEDAQARIAAAKKEADATKKEADVMATAAVDKATADTRKKLNAAELGMERARTEATAAIRKAMADVTAAVEKGEAEKQALAQKYKAELAATREAFTLQLAEARQGGVVQITPAEVLTQDRAARDYNAGVSAYQSKSFAKALTALESAVKLDPADARYWYYLGLTQWELGKTTDAQSAFKKGSELEARNRPNAAQVGEALERIQGSTRKELQRYRQ